MPIGTDAAHEPVADGGCYTQTGVAREGQERSAAVSTTISYLFTTALTLSVLFTLSVDPVESYKKVTASWDETQERLQDKTHTVINGPTGQWAGAEPTVELTIANIGKVALERFADWDVVFEIQTSPGLGVQHLTPNPPKDTDGRREESGRGVRELQGK